MNRRDFLASAAGRSLLLASLPALLSSASAEAAKSAPGQLVVDDSEGALGRTESPVAAAVTLSRRWQELASNGRLALREQPAVRAKAATEIPAQALRLEGSDQYRLCWLMPPGPAGSRTFKLVSAPAGSAPTLRAMFHAQERQFDLLEREQRVLRYNYSQVEPGTVLSQVSEPNRKYAVARSNYIHPLFGPHGEMLTRDWSIDHPHHRGIYWAWPEVDWRDRRGDLHALQQVFARPTGRCQAFSGGVFAEVDAENLWSWEDGTPILKERARIRVYRAVTQGRWVDLDFQFTALDETVKLARRNTTLYGGLNLRLNAVRDQRITKHTDPSNSSPRRSWSDLSGTFEGSSQPAGLSVIQHASNPDYPGDWVDYPELNWVQPTFPASGTRYEVRQDRPLRLRYRLWIHPGTGLPEATARDHWDAAHSPAAPW
jgi:hypothetical protein